MPAIKRSTIPGCCTGSEFYDLGAAHGVYRCKTLDEFADKFLKLGYSALNIVVTNSEQQVERGYLEEIGFVCKHEDKKSSDPSSQPLWVHIATGEQLKAGLEAHIERFRKAEEEKKKKAAEEKLKAANAFKEFNYKEQFAKGEYPSITAADIKKLKDIKAIREVPLPQVIENLFGFKVNTYTWEWNYPAEIARGLNYRIQRLKDTNKKV